MRPARPGPWLLGLSVVLLLACSAPAAAPAAPATSTAPGPAAAPAARSGPVTLEAGLIGGTSDAGIYIAIEKGYFAQEGLEVVPEIVPSTTVMVSARGAGQLDLLGPAIAASLFNAGARQVALCLVADKGSTPGPAWDFATLMVRRDLIDGGQVRDYADLRGLTIALAGQANAPEIELAKAAAIVIEPVAARIETMGTAVRWRGVSEIYGNQQVAAVVFGPALGEERPEVGRCWMVA